MALASDNLEDGRWLQELCGKNISILLHFIYVVEVMVSQISSVSVSAAMFIRADWWHVKGVYRLVISTDILLFFFFSDGRYEIILKLLIYLKLYFTFQEILVTMGTLCTFWF